MIKKTGLSIFFVYHAFAFSQQTAQLRLIKEKFDKKLEINDQKCKLDREKNPAPEVILMINELCKKTESSINARRNQENLAELERIKKEGTGNIIDPAKLEIIPNVEGEDFPEYVGGMNAFRNEVMANFDTDRFSDDKTLKCEVAFIVERDGSISSVNATGTDKNFNMQSELAVYLTKNKFSIPRLNGVPVRFRMRVPLTLSFE